MSAIFISHSSRDGEAAGRLRERLAARRYPSVFLDFDPEAGIPAGRDWEQELYRQLRTCRAVIVLCSRHSMASRWCFAEIVHARSLGKHIFPLRLDDCEVHPVLATRQVLDLRGDPEQAYARLWRGLEAAGLDETFAWDGSRPPYPGLLSFDEDDAAIFFGRDAEIRLGLETLERLRRFGGPRTVLVLGASGVGKSSLLRAGLLPRLRKDEAGWLALPVFRPGEHPWRETALALARAFGEHGGRRDWRELRNELVRADLTPGRAGQVLLEHALDLRQTAKRPDATVLVTVDQVEELLADGEDGAGKSFLTGLRSALEAPGSPLMALGTLRSDLLGQLQHHAAGRDLEFVDLPVGPLAPEGVLEVIEGPARVQDLRLEDGLAEAMAADARSEDALPLLAFTLRELYERSGADGLLEIREYRQDLGGLGGSVARAAEAVLTEPQATEAECRDLNEAFLAMVRLDGEGGFARRTAHWDELPEAVRARLDRFVVARLLIERDVGGGRCLEVAHETLFRSWERLRGWLDRNREFLLWRRRLGEARREWERTRRDRRALLGGPALEEARAWRTTRTSRLAPEEREFVDESLREASRRKRRRVLAGAATVAFLAATAVGGIALWQRAEDALARSRDVTRVAAAGEWLTRDPTRAALVLLEVERPEETPLATIKMRHVLAHGLATYELVGHSKRVASAVFDQADERLVTASDDGTARIWNTDGSGEVTVLAGHQDKVAWAEASRDGGKVVTVTFGGVVRVFRADGRGAPLRLGERRTRADKAHFGPRGERVFATCTDGTVRVWRSDGSEPPLELRPPGGVAVDGARFTPRGDRLLTVSRDGVAQLWRLGEGSEPETLARGPADLLTVTFSPQADRFFALSDAGQGWMGFAGSLGEPFVVDDLGPISRSAVSLTPRGDRLAAAADDGEIRVRRLDADEEPLVLSGHRAAVLAMAIDPSGTRLASGSEDGTARVWDLAAGGESVSLVGHGAPVVHVAFDRGGGRLVTAAEDGSVRIWPAAPPGATVVLRGHQGPVLSAVFDARGERVVTASLDGTARVWDAGGSGPPIVLRGHRRPLTVARFDAPGTRVLTASEDGTARIWAADGAGDAVVLAGHGGGVETAAFSPDGERVATGSAGGEVWLWKADGGEEPQRLPGLSGLVMDVAWSPGGDRLLAASRDGIAAVWTAGVSEPATILEFPEDKILSATFGPRGQRLAVALSDGSVLIRRLDGGADVTLAGHGHAAVDVRFDATGERVISASNDGTARVWNADGSGAPVVLEGHTERLTAASFSPDGKMAVTASGDGTARVWWLDREGEPLQLEHPKRVTGASFSPGGNRVLTSSEDGTARIWTISPTELQKQIAAMVRTCLDRAFRRNVLGEPADEAERAYEACERSRRAH